MHSDPKGNRKKQATRETALMILCGFLVSVWMHADYQLFIPFAVAMVGGNASFMWGNAQEHKAANTGTKATDSAQPAKANA